MNGPLPPTRHKRQVAKLILACQIGRRTIGRRFRLSFIILSGDVSWLILLYRANVLVCGVRVVPPSVLQQLWIP